KVVTDKKMAKNLATDMAPPFVLVAHYFIAAAIFYAISSFLLPFYANEVSGYFLSSSIASLMHLYLLGFVMMTIFGAMYQLVPVVLEIPIFSKDFAYIQFYMFVGGILIFTFGLWDENYTQILPYGAMLMYVSMLIFVANVFLTYRNIMRWDIVAKFILVSNLFLLVGVTIGFFIALNLVYGFYPDIINLVQMHIATTIFGYVIMTVMGIGMILLPMFSLSHGFKQIAIEMAFYTIIAGLLLFLVGTLLNINLLKFSGVIFTTFSIFAALYQMYLIFSTRIRKQNDFWAKNMMASFATLIISFFILVAGIIIKDDTLYLLFGFTLFFGFFTFFVVGHIYKILPFLVWYQRYSPLVGKLKVPMLNDMVHEKVADIQFWITLIGLILAIGAITFKTPLVFQVGTMIMGIGTLLVIYNIYYTLIYGIDELENYYKENPSS
ncbi:MAG: hypothetical protein L3J44_09825, partial [Campylobacteraceae bacterium]|nr:hypothetical protein [Campylobacteraceae bacterium]